MALKIKPLDSNKLTCYRTRQSLLRYCDVHSTDEIVEAFGIAEAKGWKTYVLGGGSNTFFNSATVKTFIIKNAIEPRITQLSEDVLEVSSSVPIGSLLRHLYRNNREGPYYLAALPATLGGVIAMNAGRGRGHNKCISDYVLSVSFYHHGKIHEWTPSEYDASYRHTKFLDLENAFILSAKMRFEPHTYRGNPIEERRAWCRTHQDLSGPTCGSVFCAYNSRVLSLFRRFVRFLPAKFSIRTGNWIVNRSDNPIYLRILIDSCIFLHRMLGQEVELELRRVV